MASKKREKQPQRLIKVAHVLENLPLEEQTWERPQVLKANEVAWKSPRALVGNLSRIDYFSPGFRRGVLQCHCEILANEGVHFIKINGGLIRKDFFAKKLRQEIEKAKGHVKGQRAKTKLAGNKIEVIPERELRAFILNNLMDEAAKALAAMLPKIKKPGHGPAEYVRYYITTSPRYDGEYGDEIARRLQSLRTDDIRHYRPGSARTPLKGSKVVLWSLNETKNRIPGRYHSQPLEKIIDEKESETSKPLPDLWMVGSHDVAIYTPAGLRKIPYVGIPGSSAIEGVTTGENQVGVMVVDQNPRIEKERLVRFYSIRDAIADEREFITGISRGARGIHRKIVEALKQEGSPMSVGQLADALEISDRKSVERALEFLKLESASARKTWPGLNYDAPSQLWDFHREWIQTKLRYILPPREDWLEDNFLFFGCMHAGYTTVDYEFIVKRFPEIMLSRNTQTVVFLGDLIAGLHHEFLCTGEVFSGLNNDEQEEFAAELLSTVWFRVFASRFESECAKLKNHDFAAISSAIEKSLMKLLLIPGNHDLWQELDGNTPFKTFLPKFTMLLSKAISLHLLEKKIPVVDVISIVSGKLFNYPDTSAWHDMPSKIRIAMTHPHMGGSSTTSRNAQDAIGMHDAQIAGIANFHRATVVHKWIRELGQCVAVKAGTLAIYTRFERRKMKHNNDFGPISLRTMSHDGRIIMTEVGYYTDNILKEAIRKSTDIDVLRKKLNLLTA